MFVKILYTMKYEVHIKHFSCLVKYDGWLKGKALILVEPAPYFMEHHFYLKEEQTVVIKIDISGRHVLKDK